MQLTANPYKPGADDYYMHEALQVAHEGLGWTAPNPLVGCVLVQGDTIVARAGHRYDGQEHAEVLALRQAGEAARGSTCYVTLEPCSHVCRQPSCCHELAAAGVSRVVYGCEDADQRSAGRALSVLRELGLAVTPDVLQRQCAALMDYYLDSQRRHRAFVHLKLALSADGKLACANGASQWLSGPESLGFAHYLRQKYDAVLVGWRTVLADDPRLTVRPGVLDAYRPLPEGTNPRCPVRVVLDPYLRLLRQLDHLRLVDFSGTFREHLPRLVLACREDAADAAGLPAGSMVLPLPQTGEGSLSLPALSQELWKLGIRSLLVEGGAGLAQELLRQQAADKLSLAITPMLIGSDGMGFTPVWRRQSIADCLQLQEPTGELLGRDLLLCGYLSANRGSD